MSDTRRVGKPGELRNLRDLGGFPAALGATRSGTVFRSAGPGEAEPGAAGALAALGVRTVVDLREADEAQAVPYDLGDSGIVRLHRPLLTGLRVAAPGDDFFELLVVDAADRLVAALADLVAAAADGPVLVHCAAGKDRTGVLCALALSALGVPDAPITADFALSNELLGLEPSAVPGERPPLIGGHRYTRPEHLVRVMEQVRSAGGDVPGYLRRHGFEDADFARLQDALTGPAAAAA